MDENFQKKREENYQKDIERERMEQEKLQRENEEMKNKLSQLSTLHSSSLQVIYINLKYIILNTIPIFRLWFSLVKRL